MYQPWPVEARTWVLAAMPGSGRPTTIPHLHMPGVIRSEAARAAPAAREPGRAQQREARSDSGRRSFARPSPTSLQAGRKAPKLSVKRGGMRLACHARRMPHFRQRVLRTGWSPPGGGRLWKDTLRQPRPRLCPTSARTAAGVRFWHSCVPRGAFELSGRPSSPRRCWRAHRQAGVLGPHGAARRRRQPPAHAHRPAHGLRGACHCRRLRTERFEGGARHRDSAPLHARHRRARSTARRPRPR